MLMPEGRETTPTEQSYERKDVILRVTKPGNTEMSGDAIDEASKKTADSPEETNA